MVKSVMVTLLQGHIGMNNTYQTSVDHYIRRKILELPQEELCFILSWQFITEIGRSVVRSSLASSWVLQASCEVILAIGHAVILEA